MEAEAVSSLWCLDPYEGRGTNRLVFSFQPLRGRFWVPLRVATLHMFQVGEHQVAGRGLKFGTSGPLGVWIWHLCLKKWALARVLAHVPTMSAHNRSTIYKMR